MDAKKLFLSLIPRVLFSVLVQRIGAGAVGFAALAASALSLSFAIRHRASGIKIIDTAGIVTFLAMAALAFAGSDALKCDIANYGRATLRDQPARARRAWAPTPGGRARGPARPRGPAPLGCARSDL